MGASSGGAPFPGLRSPERAPHPFPARSSSAGGGFCSREGRSCAPGRHQLLRAARWLPAPEPSTSLLEWLPGEPGTLWRLGRARRPAARRSFARARSACPLEKPWRFFLQRQRTPPRRWPWPRTFPHLLRRLPRGRRVPSRGLSSGTEPQGDSGHQGLPSQAKSTPGVLCSPRECLARPTKDHPGSQGGKRLQLESNGFTGGWGGGRSVEELQPSCDSKLIHSKI